MQMHHYHSPPNCGICTHVEVCNRAAIDPKIRSSPPPNLDAGLVPDKDLSYRGNRCLSRAGIPPTKVSVRNALGNGLLSPGRPPSNNRPETHVELCR